MRIAVPLLALASLAAADPTWDVSRPPKDPVPHNSFITKYIETLNRERNDSTDFDKAVQTIVLNDDNLKPGLARLCAALLRDDFKDIYGACSIVQELIRRKKMAQARQLLPFIMVASQRVTDPGDLEQLAYTVPLFEDKRVVPRLIELLEHADKEVKEAAAGALASLTGLGSGITPERAKSWWESNRSLSEKEIWRRQLRASEAAAALAAADRLIPYRDKDLVPVVIAQLKADDRKLIQAASDIAAKVLGPNWAVDSMAPKPERLKKVALLEKWWRENAATFEFPPDPRLAEASGPGEEGGEAPAEPVDPLDQVVAQLDAIDTTVADTAGRQLSTEGRKSVPALIKGLERGSIIVRRRCDELLKQITKKQDIPVNPRGGAEEIARAVEAWKAWAVQEKLIAPPAEAEGEMIEETAPSPPAKDKAKGR